MIKRPERIKIVSRHVAVKYVPKGTNGLDEDNDGEWHPEKQLVLIQEDLEPETEKVTVIHEIIHAISDEMDLDLSEAQVTGLAKGLIAVWMDNPSFARYLIRKP